MSYLRLFIALSVFFTSSAAADIWKWIDADGTAHFVSTQTAIYTWVDSGKTFYSDKPDHEDAVLVQLIWHSKGTLTETESALDNGDVANGSADDDALPSETPQERAAREIAEAHHCKRVTEIYDSYKNAPRLYRTGAKGEREYLSKRDAQATMDDAKSKKDDACK